MKTASRRVVALCVVLGMMFFGFTPQASAETQGERGDFNSEVSFSADGTNFVPYPVYDMWTDEPRKRIPGTWFSGHAVTYMKLESTNPQDVRVLVRVRDIADFENDSYERHNPSDWTVRADVDGVVLGEWNMRDLYEQTPQWDGQDWVKELETVRQLGDSLVVQGEPGEVKKITFSAWLPDMDHDQMPATNTYIWTTVRAFPIKVEPSPPEEPTSTEEPSPTEEPSVPLEPSPTVEPSESEEPPPVQEPSEPSTTEDPTPTGEPTPSEEPTPTEDPMPTEGPTPTGEPTDSGEPKHTDEPSPTQGPSGTGEPSPTDEPSPTGDPVPTDERTSSQEPSEVPGEPSPTEAPSSTPSGPPETPVPSSYPSEPAEPSGSSEPSASATPSPDGQGSLSPAGSSPAEEPAWHPITSASVPPTLPDESPSDGETASAGEPSTTAEPSSTEGPTPGEKRSVVDESPSSGESASAAASSRPGPLARTGLDSGVVVLGSLLVIGAGISAVLVARHRARKA